MTIMRSALLGACALAFAFVAPPSPAQTTDQQTASLNIEQLFATSCGWCHQNGGRAEGRDGSARAIALDQGVGHEQRPEMVAGWNQTRLRQQPRGPFADRHL